MSKDYQDKRSYEGRKIESISLGIPCEPAKTGDNELDLITLLRGTWISRAEGWNLIALPASPSDLINLPPNGKPFRILMNQYGETLKFNVSDANVPNRGLKPDSAGGQTPNPNDEPDQLIDAIAYEQIIVQKAVEDFPLSKDGVRAANGQPIHHEPGFFMQFLNHVLKGTSPDVGDGNELKELKIARMGTIPHGNSVLAMGYVSHDPKIKDSDAFPERLKEGDLHEDFKNDFKNNPNLKPYLEPYQHFIKHPFLGCIGKKSDDFHGFSPDNVNAILRDARKKLRITKTTVLNFDTKFKVAGIDDAEFDAHDKPISGFPISNVPFVKREANVTEMHATFWIMELKKTDSCAEPEFVMQYSQTVYLEFFDSPLASEIDEHGKPRRIRWPHVSINTLRKVGP